MIYPLTRFDYGIELLPSDLPMSRAFLTAGALAKVVSFQIHCPCL